MKMSQTNYDWQHHVLKTWCAWERSYVQLSKELCAHDGFKISDMGLDVWPLWNSTHSYWIVKLNIRMENGFFIWEISYNIAVHFLIYQYRLLRYICIYRILNCVALTLNVSCAYHFKCYFSRTLIQNWWNRNSHEQPLSIAVFFSFCFQYNGAFYIFLHIQRIPLVAHSFYLFIFSSCHNVFLVDCEVPRMYDGYVMDCRPI